MNKQRRMLTFLLLWFGQLVSLLGTKMTRFALLIWVFQETGQATAMALLGFFSFGAVVVMSPLAGYWVDRLDRRRVMLFADLGAGLMTLIVLLFITQGTLQLWHLYVTQMFIGFFDAFHTPAYAAATSVLLPKRHYARANGLRSLAIATADIAAPMFAGVLFAFIGVQGVMLIDVLTLLIAAATLLFIRIPVPQAQPHADAQPDENFRQQLSFGLRYIAQRKGLMGLLAVMMIINLFAALTYYGIFPAMILARTDGDETALGIVAAALGIGGVIGSILMSTWGGPKRRIHGVLAYTAIFCLVLVNPCLCGLSAGFRLPLSSPLSPVPTWQSGRLKCHRLIKAASLPRSTRHGRQCCRLASSSAAHWPILSLNLP